MMKIITVLISLIPLIMGAETKAQPLYISRGGIDRNGFSYGVGYQCCISIFNATAISAGRCTGDGSTVIIGNKHHRQFHPNKYAKQSVCVRIVSFVPAYDQQTVAAAESVNPTMRGYQMN